MAMMAMTTNSSINVKPRLPEAFFVSFIRRELIRSRCRHPAANVKEIAGPPPLFGASQCCGFSLRGL
jgi:hypothetical protein